MPNASVARDPARGDAYFDGRFGLGQSQVLHWWLMVDEDKVGFARVALQADHDGPWAEIGDFYIEPSWRHRGCGRGAAEAVVG